MDDKVKEFWRVFLPSRIKRWTEYEKYSKIYIRNVIGKYSWRV